MFILPYSKHIIMKTGDSLIVKDALKAEQAKTQKVLVLGL